MRRTVPVLIFALLAGALFAADDPGGWSKAKWYMTEAQLAGAFGADHIVRVPMADHSTAPGLDIELDGKPFRAVFGLKDGGLASVSLAPRQDQDRNGRAFQSLVDLLVQKYGRPWKSERGEMFRTVEYQWSFPTTVISLSLTTTPGVEGVAILDLNYHRTAADPL